MWRQIAPAFRMMVVLTILTGLIYPGVVTGVCQLFFPHKANGSLIIGDGRVIGSSLIGQNFQKPEYFQPRPSAAGSDGYDASASGGSNYGPTNQKLADRVRESIAAFREANPDFKGSIPADLLTTSFSGLDPHISPASAEAQAARIAQTRGLALQQVQNLIGQFTEGRDLGFLGEPRVNVLAINLALDEQLPHSK